MASSEFNLTEALKDVEVVQPEPEVHEEDAGETVGIEEILWQYREVILDLDRRVSELEARPQFAASLRTKKTGH